MKIKIYKIFLKKSKDGIIEDLELLKDGFNIWAFIFQLFYLLYKKLWLESLVVFIIMSILNFLQYKFVSPNIIIPIQIGISLYIGFEFSDWKSKRMIKLGYEFLGYTSGNDTKEAKLKFLDNINSNYTKDDKLEQKIF